MNPGRPAVAIAVAIALAAAGGCGDSDEDARDGGAKDETAAIEPAGPAATEASPEAPATPTPGGTGELSASDEAAVDAAARAYVDALNARDGAAVCRLLAASAVDVGELPLERGGCASSLDASIGFRRPGGTPAWKRTTIRKVTAVAVGERGARVTATVSHDFADREYVSIEEDVIYLERSGERWLIAKPSGSFYRAVGYPEPPLRALTPPSPG